MKTIKLILVLLFIVKASIHAQWFGCEGPSGGEIGDIVSIESSLFVSAGNGGIYKSVDNGESWTKANVGIPSGAMVHCLVESKGVLYISLYGKGLYKSTTNGKSWEPINSGIEFTSFYKFAVQESKIFAGNANGGIYYSSDNGDSWLEKSTGVSGIQFQSFTFFNSEVYACGGGQTEFYKSSNDGDSWESIDLSGLGQNNFSKVFATETKIYLGGTGFVFTSTDGENWTKTSLNTNATIKSMDAIADSVFLTTSSGRIYYTTNEGNEWTLIQNAETSSFVNDVIFLDDEILMSTTDGIYSSKDNGVSWLNSNKGINALTISSIAKNETSLFVGTERNGIHRYKSAEGWSRLGTEPEEIGSSNINDIQVVDNLLIAGIGGGVYTSNEDGNSWLKAYEPGENKSVQALDFNQSNLAIAVNGTGVFISKDTAKTWDLAGTNGLNIETPYKCLRVKGDTIAVSTQGGEIFLSKDLGESWKDISITGGYFYTYDLQFNNNKLFAGTGRGLLVSETLGDSWKFITNDQKPVQSIVFKENKIYVSSENGVYLTTESRNVWYDVSGDLGHQSVNELCFYGDTLYAGTSASSLWKGGDIEEDLKPIILGSKLDLVTNEDEAIVLSLSDLNIKDDNSTEDDMSLSIVEGENYSFENNEVSPSPDYFGDLAVNIIVDNGLAESKKFALPISVTSVNDKPEITSALTSKAIVDFSFSYTAVATDIDNDKLSFTISEHPEWLSIEGSIVSGTPPEGIDEESFMLTVNDGNGGTASQKVTITVYPHNTNPEITSDTTSEATEDVLFTYTATATDTENNGLSFSISNNSDWLSISENIISGTATEGIPDGKFDLTVEDGIGGSTTKTITINVTPVNDAPEIIKYNGNTSIPEDESFEIKLEDIEVSDVDNNYPDDFELKIIDEDNYEVENNKIKPIANFVGAMSVSIQVNDGELDSEEFVISFDVTATGIEGMSIEDSFRLYPNPTFGVSKIMTDLSGEFKFSVYTVQGELKYTSNMKANSEKVIDLSHLMDGVYFVRIDTKDGNFVTKLIKK